jgi:hypothetical protein
MKVKLCYTASNADSDWLEEVFEMNLDNFQDIIDKYIHTNLPQAEALNDKWYGEDSLYLNFRVVTFLKEIGDKQLFRLILELLHS